MIADFSSMAELSEPIWSNFDHAIDREVEQQLRKGDCWAKQPAWNYWGRVWFADGQFHEQVNVYGAIIGVISADTIEELHAKICETYGVS